MLEFLLAALAAVRVFLRSRQDTALEILALRQQLAVLSVPGRLSFHGMGDPCESQEEILCSR